MLTIIARVVDAVLHRIFGPDPTGPDLHADGQKHWNETGDALARIEEEKEVLDPGDIPPWGQR